MRHVVLHDKPKIDVKRRDENCREKKYVSETEIMPPNKIDGEKVETFGIEMRLPKIEFLIEFGDFYVFNETFKFTYVYTCLFVCECTFLFFLKCYC